MDEILDLAELKVKMKYQSQYWSVVSAYKDQDDDEDDGEDGATDHGDHFKAALARLNFQLTRLVAHLECALLNVLRLLLHLIDLFLIVDDLV